MTDRNLMPIGRFARSCRLSVKALRHYDELGLLEPAFVDPQSKYRYYSRDQARDAVMIGMLRSLDLSLAVIRKVLAAEPADLKAVIDEETARIETELTAYRQSLLSLRHLAQAGGLARYEIAIEEHPERRIAKIRVVTDSTRLIPDSTNLIYTLLDELRNKQVEFRDTIFTINEFTSGADRVAVDACVVIVDESPTLGLAEVTCLPRTRVAGLTHIGPYETLGLAHHALFAWVQERGHEPLGPIWEFYANDPADVSSKELITQVALPLDERGEPEVDSPR